MTSRGIRNRNPGNIEDGRFTQGRPGYTGPEPNGRFATFETMGHGIAALIALLRIYRKQHNLTTVRGIINRWAPPEDNNDVSAYVTAVCGNVVRPDEELPDEPNTYLFLAKGIARHENGADAASITSEDWEAGMALAGFAAPTLNEAIAIESQPTQKKEGILAPFALIAWKALLTSIPTLIRHFGSGQRSEENAKLAEVVVPLAAQAIGATNEQELTEKLANDPGAIQTIDRAIQSNWLVVSEAGGGGIEGARKADMAVVALEGPWWGFLRSPSFWALLLLIPLVYIIVLSIVGVLGPVVWSDDVRAAIAGTIVGTIVGGAVGYYWGQSTSRNRGPTPGY